MAERMLELAARQPGFLDVESARSVDGLGITVSYWESEEAIAGWRRHIHNTKLPRKFGKRVWYSEYRLRVAKVERDYRYDSHG